MKKFLDKYRLFVYGGIAVFIYEVVLTSFLTEIFGIWYFYSYVIALSTGIFLLFFYHRHVTFIKTDKAHRRIAKFIILLIGVYYLNLQFVYVLTEKFDIAYLISITLISSILSILSYTLNKIWVFRTY